MERELPSPSSSHVAAKLRVQFAHWYPYFRARRCTIKSTIISLPGTLRCIFDEPPCVICCTSEDFIAFLNEDSVKAPVLAHRTTQQSQLSDDSDVDWSDENDSDAAEDDAPENAGQDQNRRKKKAKPRRWCFPELELAVETAAQRSRSSTGAARRTRHGCSAATRCATSRRPACFSRCGGE